MKAQSKTGNKLSSPLKRSAMLLLIGAVSMTGCFVIDPFDEDNWESGRYTATEPFEYSVGAGSYSGFQISGVNGSIEIIGQAGLTTVEIWGVKRVRSKSTSDAERHLEDLIIHVGNESDRIFVQTIQPRVTEGREYSVEYHIRIPDTWTVAAANTNGDVTVDSLSGSVYTALTNGNIRLRNISGDVETGITNGDIQLLNIQGNVQAGTTNGNLSGDIVIPEDGRCSMATVNGGISLDIPADTSAELEARVTNGSITVTGLALNNLVSSKRKVQGVLADGNGRIFLSVVNGGIDVQGY